MNLPLSKLGIIVLSLFYLVIYPVAGEEKATIKNLEKGKEKSGLSEPHVGKVALARALIGSSINNNSGQSYGKIEEIVIDIGSGKVHAVFMAPTPGLSKDEKSQDTLFIPYASLECSEKDNYCFTIPKLPEKDEKKNEEANSKSRMIMVNKTKSIEVRDKAGETLGKIVDFALTRGNDRVAYAIFTTKSDKDYSPTDTSAYYPIPLSAFVVKKQATDWTLDLSDNLLRNTPTFQLNKLPNEVDGTWTEYVHVRYGRAILGGVQSDQAKDSKEKK
jgi:sporulation protein YlmC with PRC-barrel domain